MDFHPFKQKHYYELMDQHIDGPTEKASSKDVGCIFENRSEKLFQIHVSKRDIAVKGKVIVQ